MRDESASDDLYDSLLRSARRERTFDSDGAATVWRIWGEVRGSLPRDTLLLVHGSFGSWTHWVRNIEAFAKRFRVVAVDTPGFGSSDEIRAGNSVAGIGRHLAQSWMQLRCRLDGDVQGDDHGNSASRLWVCGFSLGAVHAGELIRQLQHAGTESSNPVSVATTGMWAAAGLILLAPGGLGSRTIVRPEVLRIPSELRRPGQYEARGAFHRRNLALTMFGDSSCIDDLALRLQDANLAQARLRGPFISRPDLLLDALLNLPPRYPPVLAIWGDRDAFDADVQLRARALCEVRPQADVLIVPGAGHWVGYEAAATTNSAIVQWIDIHSPYSGRK